MKRFFLLFLLFYCTLTTSQAFDYYWVGGSGNWSDLSHWATTSGGTTYHLITPQSTDNVIFDANSFTSSGQKVTINVTEAYCLNMSWKGVMYNPTLDGTFTKNLHVFGSLEFVEQMIIIYAGKIYFESDLSGNTITTANRNITGSIVFNGSGEWILQDSLKLVVSNNSDFNVASGTIRSNNQYICCSEINFSTNNKKHFSLEKSTVRFHSLYNNAINATGSNLTIDPGTSTLIFDGSAILSFDYYSGNISFNNIEFRRENSLVSIVEHTFSDDTLFINKIICSSNMEFRATIVADTMLFYGNTTSLFSSVKKIIVNNDLLSNTSCTRPITFKSYNPGQQATIFKKSGYVDIDYITLQDMKIEGSAVFTANNAIDLGNNSNWFINIKAPKDFYWIGNAGNWNDSTHWSYSSGGIACLCTPSPTDNVYFNENSFTITSQTVFIEKNATCNNMDWTGVQFNPVLNGAPTGKLEIYGSLFLTPNMTIPYQGQGLYFSATSNSKIIFLGSQTLNCDIFFEGRSGGWGLASDFKTQKNINFYRGSLNTLGYNVNCRNFRSDLFDSPREIVLNNSILTISNDLALKYSTDLVFDAGHSTIVMGASVSSSTLSTILTDADHSLAFYNVDFVNTNNSILETGGCVFNKVLFSADADISRNTQFDTLIFSPGKTYKLGGGKTQKINKKLFAQGMCNAPITIKSSNASIATKFSYMLDTMEVDYTVLEKVWGTGTAKYIASNTIDMGDNQGWEINSPTPRNLYWVGGMGEWEDPNHWSLTSDGPGGECVPSPIDNVFFDDSSFTPSFQIISINTNLATCKNMEWSGTIGSPFFSAPSSLTQLKIYGSLKLRKKMLVVFAGKISFESTDTNNTITTANNMLPLSMEFNGLNGSWILQDSLIAGTLVINKGALNTNNQYVECEKILTNQWSLDYMKLVLGSSYIKITGESEALVANNSAFLDAGTSTIDFSGIDPDIHLSAYAEPLKFHNVIFSHSNGSCLFFWAGSSDTTVTFNKLTFKGNAQINGNLAIDSLLLSPSKTYNLDHQNPLVINDYFHAKGNNCFKITLQSKLPGTRAKIIKKNGAVDGDFLYLKDVEALGGATFYAGGNSDDASNNTGWVFNNAPGYIYGLGNDTTICFGNSIQLSSANFNGGISFEWNDGSTNPTFITDTAGTYSVNVTYAAGCSVSDSIEVHIAKLDSIKSNATTELCEGSTEGHIFIGAYGQNSEYIYNWNHGVHEDSLINLSSGSYEVTIVDQKGCIDSTITFNILENLKPIINVTPSSYLICQDGSATLVATGADFYQWTPNTGLSADTGSNVVVTPSTTTTYTVQGIDDFGCTNTTSVTINVDPIENPIALINGDSVLSICFGDSITLHTNDNGSKFLWNTGDTNSYINIKPANNETYYVMAYNTAGCFDYDTAIVFVNPIPLAKTNNDTTICSGSLITLSASGGDFYSWNNLINAQQIEVSPTSNTTYIVKVESNYHCYDYDTVNISVNPSPTIKVSNDTSVCQGETVSISVTGADHYLWSNNDTLSQLVFTPTQNTSLYVQGLNALNCSDYDTVNVFINPAPDLKTTNDTTICSGNAIILSASGGDFYEWNTGHSTPELVITPNQNTTYIVKAENTYNCAEYDTISVFVNPTPFVNLGSDKNLNEDETLILDAGVNADSYIWQDGNINQTYNVISTGTYSVLVEKDGCMASDTIEITIGSSILIWTPKAFTPNNDGINDKFSAIIKNNNLIKHYEILIFNRFGEVIFKTTDLNEAWDGTYSNIVATQGTYVWKLTYQMENANPMSQTGTVQLIR